MKNDLNLYDSFKKFIPISYKKIKIKISFSNPYLKQYLLFSIFILNFNKKIKGCKVRPWRYFLSNGWVYYYDKIIYRELIYNTENEEKKKELKEKIAENLDEFLGKTKDMKYALPVSIICCPGKKGYEEKNDWTKSKGFFCSQLVAASYLNMGILDYEKCTLRYFPGSFAQTSSIPLKAEFSLGPEIIVDFSK